MSKIALIDLDGVLNTYCGNFNENKINPPREGVREFLEKLSENFTIKIFTVRNKKQVFCWLQENNLLDLIEDVTDVKNSFTSIILDDRAVNFDGDFEKAYENITNFKPHWKN